MTVSEHASAGWWPTTRAALLSLHILAITLMALPAPGEGMVRQAWKDPTVQGEFALWTARCNRLGIQVTQQEFEDRLWETAAAYMDAREHILAPFTAYYDYCGTIQSWRMFAGPHFHPARLEIAVGEENAWRWVEVQRRPHLDWLAHKLDHYRLRPALYRFSWYQYVEGYDDFRQFAEWIARQAARDFKQDKWVRVRLVKRRTRSSEEVRAGAPVEEGPGPELVLDLELRR